MSSHPRRHWPFDEYTIKKLRQIVEMVEKTKSEGKRGSQELEKLKQGFFSPTLEAQVIRDADISWEYSTAPVGKYQGQARWRNRLEKQVGQQVANAIGTNNAEFFERIATYLKCRRDGKRPTAKSLKMPPQKRGRKSQLHDLRYVFVPAVFALFRKRLPEYSGEGCTKERLGRQELREAIQNEHKLAGLEDAPLISEGKLSRWIAEHQMEVLMAELPIARKAKKSQK